jgi:hypothetical protein
VDGRSSKRKVLEASVLGGSGCGITSGGDFCERARRHSNGCLCLLPFRSSEASASVELSRSVGSTS